MFRAACGFTVIILLMFSCSTSQFGWKTEPESGKKEKSSYLEDFDPLSLDDDDIVVHPMEKSPESEVMERPEPERALAGSENHIEEMVRGYRIQLLATGDDVQAREAKKDAIFTFEENVYLVFEAPLYKLRVGDCRTKKEAEELREVAIRRGFRDAWIVPSKVYRSIEDESPF